MELASSVVELFASFCSGRGFRTTPFKVGGIISLLPSVLKTYEVLFDEKRNLQANVAFRRAMGALLRFRMNGWSVSGRGVLDESDTIEADVPEDATDVPAPGVHPDRVPPGSH